MVLESGELLGLRAGACGHAEDILVAVTLGKEDDGVAAAIEVGVAVFTGEVGDLDVLARVGVEDPDVARDGRGVVLAQFVLVSLAVFVDHARSVRVVASVERGGGEDHLGRAAVDGDFVEFTQHAAGEER